MPMREVEEIKEICYDPLLIRECTIMNETWIPVDATVLSNLGEEILIHIKVRYEISEEENEGKYVVDSMESVLKR